MSSFAANMSSLAKICDPKMYDMVLKVTARLMIQVNIPEHYLSLVQDPPPKMTAEERLTWLEKVAAPLNWHVLQENQDSDPPGFSLQPFGCASNGSSSMVAHGQRSMHHI